MNRSLPAAGGVADPVPGNVQRRAGIGLGIDPVMADHEIEREAGISLSEVFLLYGQTGYRRIERRCLERVMGAHASA